jgi:CheY-like chemotaxis protein
MGGTLGATSVPEHGSHFVLRLPLVTSELAPPDGAPGWGGPGDHRLGGIKLLVAEDNDVNRLVMVEMLKSEGADVVACENGREAVDIALWQTDLMLVLMDVQMPEMDGLEATQRIKAARPGLPVVGQTAHALKEEHDKCLAAGMDATLTKPIAIDLLVSTILSHLGVERLGTNAAPTSDVGETPTPADLAD